MGAGLTALISGRSIVLNQKLASSGEGTVWTTNFPGFLAKLYHTPTPDRIEKLRVMIAHPPQNPLLDGDRMRVCMLSVLRLRSRPV